MQLRDPLFADAVAFIDAGDVAGLDALLSQNPRLLTDRLLTSEPGYFADPYLLWFVAENPIRNDRLPSNIVDVAMAIVDHLDSNPPPSRQDQLDYTVMLVATGRVPREAGVQLQLIDALVARGARPGSLSSILGHGELAAATRLIDHGAPLTLVAAVALKRQADARRLAASASPAEKTDALVVACYLADAPGVAFLLARGADPAARSMTIHRHATPLHQAVLSGSLDAVKALVAAGASLAERDAMWNGTPLGWAEHEKRTEIAAYLRAAGAGS